MKTRPMSLSTIIAKRAAGQRGFTLIEIVITFAMVAILLVLAAPSFVRYQRNSELTANTNDFIAAVSAARAEAMKRQLRTMVVPTTAGDWASGWTAFVDVDGSGAQNTGDIVLLTHEALPSTLAVSISAAAPGFVDGSAKALTFNGSGFLRLTGGSFPPTSALDITNTNETRRIVVSPAGRLRVCKPADAGCDISSL
jgi:type IV fimbrial biogenesis protein FimT